MILSCHGVSVRRLCTAALILLAALAISRPSRSFAAQAVLSWTAPATYLDSAPTTGLGYKIHVGTAPGTYTQQIDVGNVTSYTISGLNEGATYYFAVSAYDATGNVSSLSNEASKSLLANYTLTASSGPGGNINPPSTTLQAGGNYTFYITPSVGYQTAVVTVDSIPIGAVAEYSFSNVSNNHSIRATFTPEARVKLVGNIQGTFPLLQDSYAAVPDGAAATALVRAEDFSEDLNLTKDVTFTLNGGFDVAFAANSDMSVLNGTMMVSRGALVANNLIIK
jgi:hypothetical protein